MPGSRTRLNQNNREQILSSDVNRIGKLAGMELENHDLLRSVREDFYDPAASGFDDFGSAVKTAQAVAISGCTQAPSLDPQPGTFLMTLGAGEAELFGSPDDADSSAYWLLRWDSQTVDFPTPDPSNPTICLICATPGDILADLTSRNILVDPNARTVTPANVYKTQTPQASITVVNGTAAATPLPPSVPGGTLCLFEVWLPAGAADSVTFLRARRAWRRIEFPGTSQHGIVKGCIMDQQQGGAMSLTGPHRLVIDGELLTFGMGLGSGATLAPVPDATNPPTPAGTSDTPTYLYMCGGRNSPSRSYASSVGAMIAPIVIVESLTAPNAMGYPVAQLTTQLTTVTQTFQQNACLYIGLGFWSFVTGQRVPVIYDGDWINALQVLSYSDGGLTQLSLVGFREPRLVGTLSTTAYAFGSLPSVSTVIRVASQMASIGSVANLVLTSGLGGGNVIDLAYNINISVPVVKNLTRLYGPPLTLSAADTLTVALSADIDGPGVTADAFVLLAAVNMNVPRLAR